MLQPSPAALAPGCDRPAVLVLLLYPIKLAARSKADVTEQVCVWLPRQPLQAAVAAARHDLFGVCGAVLDLKTFTTKR